MRITYLSPAFNHPVGGVKVMYRHAEILSAHGFDSQIYYPENPGFNCSWFSSNAKQRESGCFDAETDFIVVPEIWASKFGAQCILLQLKFGIFVQNGYLLGSGVPEGSENGHVSVYESASVILSISSDTTRMIGLACPAVGGEKIKRIYPGVSGVFSPATKKKIISFMPRKLSGHAEKVCFYLKQYLPRDWALVPIDGLNEDQTAKVLSESSVFMSFCDQEGCPLPPLEAAFSGNIVVGYTGQGAKEYFHQPVFREVHNGDFHGFVGAVRQAVEDVERGVLRSPVVVRQREDLKRIYSGENEVEHLLNFASVVESIFQNH